MGLAWEHVPPPPPSLPLHPRPPPPRGDTPPLLSMDRMSIFKVVHTLMSPLLKLCRWSLHCKENPIYVFLFWELRGLSPNFHFYVSVSDLRIYSQDR